MSLTTSISQAAVQTKVVDYKQGDTNLEGFMAWNDAVEGPRPGVLIVHDWTGPGEFTEKQARRLAEMGYVAFAVDIYGKGVRPKSPQESGQQAGKFKNDRTLLRARVTAGLDVLKTDPHCDAKRIAAIGYCFGGTTVLELARSGADIAGVVSFHGGLDSPTPEDGKNIRCKVLVLHGADDPHAPAKDVAAFEEEMRKGGVDWQFIAYGGAVHGFTNPKAGSDPSRGVAYNAAADKRSWEAMKGFFAEIFK
jgi:dienelactone hydrolase